jgi:hypothetical protein
MDDMTLLRGFRATAPTEVPSTVRQRALTAATRRPPSRDWRPIALSGGAVVAATATLLAVNAGPAASPSAATVLDQAAAHILRTASAQPPRADQWIYSRGLDANPITGRRDARPGDSWSRVDGSQFADRMPNGRVHVQPIIDNPLGTPQQWYELAQRLPHSPEGVLDELALDRLFTSHGKTRADRDFDEVTTALTSQTVLPPEGVARLYHALSIIPGVSVDRNAPKDLVGRPVLSISYSGDLSLGMPGDRWELLLDPDTYRVIGIRGTAGHDHNLKNGEIIRRGTVWYNHAYLDQRVVDKPGQR